MEELLATLAEEVALLASDRRRQETRKVFRPGDGPDTAAPTAPSGGVVMGHQQLAALAAQNGRVRSG